MIATLVAVLVPVAVTAALGFWWGKTNRPFDSTFISSLVSNIGAPCLAFSSLTRLEVKPDAFGAMLAANMTVLATAFVLGFAALKLLRIPVRDGLPSVMFSNGGNMGLPLSLFAFGEAGLALAIVFFAGNSVMNFTVGQAIAAGRANFRAALKAPVLWTVGAAVAFMLLQLEVPRWLANTTRLLGDFAVPLMLFALGHSLARLRVASLPKSAAIAVLRLAIGLAAGFGVAWLYDLEGTTRGVLILQAMMPVAVFNYLFAQVHGSDAEAVAGAVVLSTVAAFAILPFLLAYLLPG